MGAADLLRMEAPYLIHIYTYFIIAEYHKTSKNSHALVGNVLVDHSDVVGAAPVGAAPTTSKFLA